MTLGLGMATSPLRISSSERDQTIQLNRPTRGTKKSVALSAKCVQGGPKGGSVSTFKKISPGNLTVIDFSGDFVTMQFPGFSVFMKMEAHLICPPPRTLRRLSYF